MADIPSGDYSHLHRSVFGPLGSLGSTDLRTSLVHDYKPLHVSDLRNNNINLSDRLDYLTAKTIIDGRTGSANDGNSNPEQPDMRHGAEPQDIKPYLLNNNNINSNNNNNSAPSTPPTPLSISEAHMQEAKVSRTAQNLTLHLSPYFSVTCLIHCGLARNHLETALNGTQKRLRMFGHSSHAPLLLSPLGDEDRGGCVTGWGRRNSRRPWQFPFFRNLHRKIATTRRFTLSVGLVERGVAASEQGGGYSCPSSSSLILHPCRVVVRWYMETISIQSLVLMCYSTVWFADWRAQKPKKIPSTCSMSSRTSVTVGRKE